MSIHVVLCDNEPYVSRMISWRLMRAGFEVHTANDGEAAEEIIRRVRPQLLIADLQYPGIDLICRLRSDLATARLPIILLSSATETPEMQRHLIDELGLAGILPKPCSPRQLIRLAHWATQKPVQPLCTA